MPSSEETQRQPTSIAPPSKDNQPRRQSTQPSRDNTKAPRKRPRKQHTVDPPNKPPKKVWEPFEAYSSDGESSAESSDGEQSESSVESSEHYESAEEEPPIVLKRGSGRPGFYH